MCCATNTTYSDERLHQHFKNQEIEGKNLTSTWRFVLHYSAGDELLLCKVSIIPVIR